MLAGCEKNWHLPESQTILTRDERRYLSMSHVTDEELVKRSLLGSPEAYEALVRRYKGLVFGVAYHTCGNAEDARDVAQNVFIRAYTRMSQLRDPRRIGSWLRQLAANEGRAFVANRRHRDAFSEEESSGDCFKGAEDRMLLSAALAAIDEESRLTVVLFYLHAYSMKEIGSFLDEPVTTIKSRLRNARKKLRSKMEEVLERDLDREALPDSFAERVTKIIEAAKAGDTPLIRSLLDEEPGLLDAREKPSMQTPLHIAAGAGNAPLVELLLAYGADPNALDEGDNASPLHYACERGWLETVRLLVEAGSDVNWTQDLHERGPLGWAVIFDRVQQDVAAYLLANGAKMDIFSAIALGDIEAVRAIAKNNPAALNQRLSECDHGLPVIEVATAKKQFQIARLLVELGSEVTLAGAAGLGLVDRMEALIQGADTSEIDHSIWSAVRAGQIDSSRLLLDKGANPNSVMNGTSLLFEAIGTNNSDLARLLIQYGGDIEFKDAHWNSSPLGWQVFFGRPDSTRLALELGAKVNPDLVDLARAGEKGELRRFSSGKAKEYREVGAILKDALGV